jgi:hypothetical protein
LKARLTAAQSKFGRPGLGFEQAFSFEIADALSRFRFGTQLGYSPLRIVL